MSAPYGDSSTEQARLSKLVTDYAPLVKKTARHVASRLPDTVLLDDLVQIGMMGLIEAAQHYNPGKGASFATYAAIRIRGKIIDELRRWDWIPRSVYSNMRKISEAIQAVEARTQRDAKDAEVAAELQLSLEAYQKLLTHCYASRIINFAEMGVPEDLVTSPHPEGHTDLKNPEVMFQHSVDMGLLSNEIEQLPERERMVLSLYYDDRLNFKEIGKVIGVSESRICQIHSQALARLRARLVRS